jgi:hypothetical protein
MGIKTVRGGRTLQKGLGSVLQLSMVALLLIGCAGGQQDTDPGDAVRVLFIGNSFTFYHDMPTMFAELVRAGGREAVVEIEAPGGQSLSGHAISVSTLEKIATGDWDYVVLQEQSSLPVQQDEREGQMLSAARILSEMIQDSGGRPVLFMTWGYRDGLPDKGFPDFPSMQSELAAAYTGIAEELDAAVAPVGIAWQNGLAEQSQLDLWDSDGRHPSKTGSYLAACVFYATICRESPEGLSYRAGLKKKTAGFLQTVAAETVLADPQQWNIIMAGAQQ